MVDVHACAQKRKGFTSKTWTKPSRQDGRVSGRDGLEDRYTPLCARNLVP